MKDYSEAIVPPRKMVRLVHNALGTLTSGAANLAKRWYSNSVFQPEVGTTGSASQFATWATFYSQYRVIEFSYKAELINIETIPVAVGIYNGSQDPTTTANIDVTRQPLGKCSLVSGLAGMNKKTFRGKYSLTQIYGEANIGEDYAALITASPSDLAYFAVVCQTSTGAALGTGVSYIIDFSYWVEFFGRNKLA